MSRKRDTNWSRDEITVLLDSMMDITRKRSQDGKRTNSREIFEYAAKKLGEKGHTTRAEREKCRAKWKKMKEEYTHAKRAREGDSRYKEAPGILPFYDRVDMFINGNFDNISPHSTIVRRTCSSSNRSSPAMRTSARIAANINGTTPTTPTTTATTISNSSIENNDTSSTNLNRTNASSELSTTNLATTNNANTSSSRQATRLSTAVNQATNNNEVVLTTNTNDQHNSVPNGEVCSIYAAYNGSNQNSSVLPGNVDTLNVQPTEHADISYRVSSGCRQITIFGDHDVDIKFRGDCVTINKIDVDYPTADV